MWFVSVALSPAQSFHFGRQTRSQLLTQKNSYVVSQVRNLAHPSCQALISHFWCCRTNQCLSCEPTLNAAEQVKEKATARPGDVKEISVDAAVVTAVLSQLDGILY